MNAIVSTFKKPRVLLPVVHALDEAQVRREINVVMSAGADGVMLIDQGGLSWTHVVRLGEDAVRDGVPFVGVNLLRITRTSAADVVASGCLQALWVDAAGVDIGNRKATLDIASKWKMRRRARSSSFLFFGGVAFKYQPTVAMNDLEATAKLAVEVGIDVVTTSGDATDTPPSIDKLEHMSAGLGDHALAVASGVTIENVGSMRPFVNAFLVSSWLEKESGAFDPVRVRDLAQAVHQ